MMKIKGFSTVKFKYCGRKENRKKLYNCIKDKSITECNEIQEVQGQNATQDKVKSNDCFALVVVRKIPWYKRLAKSIRNFFVVYRWRKAR